MTQNLIFAYWQKIQPIYIEILDLIATEEGQRVVETPHPTALFQLE